jgi:2',3'-cyclic-nucleotide 2'-phosphodiesterase (5'-nucleotidase family)
MSRSTRRTLGVAVAGICAAALAAPALAAPTAGPDTSKAPGKTQFPIQILSFNDFHGNLEAPSGSSGRIAVDHVLDTADADGDKITDEAADVNVNAGGVEYLATHLAEARKGHPYSLTVAAGDLVGASPLLSAAFHDEPTIEALNAVKLDVSAVGNHEFDEGYKELQRLQSGGCIDDGDGKDDQNSCPDGSFDGASFQFLAANVIERATGKTILPPYAIKNVNGAKIGFIGMTLEGTPNIVTAAGVAGLEFKDEVETANALVPELKAQGVNAIVVLLHEGGDLNRQPWTYNGKTYQANPTYDYVCQGGGSLKAGSPILAINSGLSSEIDMVVTGHTHQPYVCDLPDGAGNSRLVTSASSFGRLYTDTTVTYDRRTSDIVRPTMKESANHIVTRTVQKDPFQTQLISTYKELVRPIASAVIGSITGDVTRATNNGGESALGDLIADAQLSDPTVVTGGQTPVIAFMNPGGIRTDLTYANSPYGEPAGDVTYEEAFSVQPFNNYLVSLTLTGAQIKELLRQQWSGVNAASPKILQVSEGFSYTYSGTTLGTVTLGGAPIVDGQSYRIVTNNFLADGGDGFPAFTLGTGKYFGGLDIKAFSDYLKANSPYTPGALTRIVKQ